MTSMKQGCGSMVIVVVATVLGAVVSGTLFRPYYPWTLVSPPGVDIVDMQVYTGRLLILARTADGRVLSTGLTYPGVSPLHLTDNFTDISGGHTWSAFPDVAWQKRFTSGLFIRYEGNVYRVDASGQWQQADASDSLLPCEEAHEVELSSYGRVGPLFGEVVKVQPFPAFEGPLYLYALVKGKGVFQCEMPRGLSCDAMCQPALPGAIIGSCAGCFLVSRRRRES